MALPRHATAASAASQLKRIHSRIGGRLGVHILDSQSGKRITFDDDSRFAMSSTFKLCRWPPRCCGRSIMAPFPLVHELPVGRDDVLANSPVIEARVAAGVSAMIGSRTVHRRGDLQ